MLAQLFCKRKKYLIYKRASSYFFSQTSCKKKKGLVGVGPNKMQQLDWLDLLVPSTLGFCFFFFYMFFFKLYLDYHPFSFLCCLEILFEMMVIF
jgi:hypothetical protein